MVLRRCSICDQNFTKAEHFLRHKRSHTGERPYECPICKKRFSRSDVLFRHSKLHTEQGGDDRPRKQSTNGQQYDAASAATAPTPPQKDNQDVLSNERNDRPERVSNTNMIAPPAFESSHTDQISHLSIPDMPLGHMEYEMSTAQQSSISHVSTGHAYETTTYGQMPGFPSSLNGQMSGQVYDPQLVTMDSRMTRSDMMPNHYGQATSVTNPENQSPDMLQYWLAQADDNFSYAALNFLEPPEDLYNSTNVSTSMQPPLHPAVSEVSDGTTSTSNIPNERFGRVEACWHPVSSGARFFGPNFWDDVITSPGPNIFMLPSAAGSIPAPHRRDSRWGISSELKQRLEAEFGVSNPTATSGPGNSSSFPRPKDSGVPPPEVLEICLDAYFRRFHPLAPFIHIATFSANSTPLPLLYAMCLLGLSSVKMGGNYIKHAFRTILRRVMKDLALDAVSDANVGRRLSTYAAGCLTLSLAALSGDHEQITHAQSLHTALLAQAQTQGLFAVDEVRVQGTFARSTSRDDHWQAWGRLDSVKRLTICLLSNDWWYSAYFSRSPIVRPEGIQVCIPSDNAVFRADSPDRWEQLMMTDKYRLTFPVLRPRTLVLEGSLEMITGMSPPLHGFGQYALLSIIKLWQCDTQCRHFLISDDWDRHDHLIPWCSYDDDMRGRSLIHVVLALAPMLTSRPELADLNALVLWHNICMTLNANIHIFELAAGRSGAEPATKALADITEWTQTSSARRACVHAAQILKLLHNRKVSEPITIDTVTAIFHAALVLGLFLFVRPESEITKCDVVFDVSEDVNWVAVGAAGMSGKNETWNSSSTTAARNADMSEPATIFIERGGAVSLAGSVIANGYLAARRTFLDFAHVMDEMGMWKPRSLSRILHIMSDVLEGPN
ncbi:hypothetical protein AAFC00_006194 [Neodothiora populina]|uniref:C2H2-type domain-containing protein n=1 Tax=Neodothiora populina TaxID=2781224 RepID=A0ABR3P552_9PEZI